LAVVVVPLLANQQQGNFTMSEPTRKAKSVMGRRVNRIGRFRLASRQGTCSKSRLRGHESASAESTAM
jgi:hypothetical protein